MSRDVLVSFAENLRRRRKELGLSQEQLGARANIQMADISRYESGSRDPRITTIARLAQALEVPIADLLEGSETTKPRSTSGVYAVPPRGFEPRSPP